MNYSITIKNLRLFSEKSELFVNGIFKDAKNFNADVNVKDLEIDKILDNGVIELKDERYNGGAN